MIGKLLLLILILAAMASMTGCTPGNGHFDAKEPAGFFWGIWHGWIAPVSLVIGLFDNTTRIYETNNTGWFYDLGFYIAIIGGFGGISLSRKKMKRKEVRQVYVETKST